MTPVLNATPTVTHAIAGLHHVTAITGDVQRNADFYTRTLGLRMVKVTINYDDPGSYHLYYGDGLGRPGTAMTFFGWPGGRRGTQGTGQVAETAFNIPVGAAAAWMTRLAADKVDAVETIRRFGAAGVAFRDPDGLPLALIENPAAPDLHVWGHGGVAPEMALRGFHGVTLNETREEDPADVLVNRFWYRMAEREGSRVRFETTVDATARYVDVLLNPHGGRPHMGTGEVHHVAFRTPDDAQQAQWLEVLRRDGHQVSPVMDRDYFHSIYFREAGGTLFEIATDTPGFTANESAENLGTRVMLPPWLEAERAKVEGMLPRLKLAERVAPAVTVA